jgi:hypothetical protein
MNIAKIESQAMVDELVREIQKDIVYFGKTPEMRRTEKVIATNSSLMSTIEFMLEDMTTEQRAAWSAWQKRMRVIRRERIAESARRALNAA